MDLKGFTKKELGIAFRSTIPVMTGYLTLGIGFGILLGTKGYGGMTGSLAFWSVAVMAAVTLLLRVLPFLLFGGKRKTPPFVLYLGKALPYAIMGMLVVYCLRNVHITAAPHGLPELIACAVVALLYVWRRNTLLSILCGTVCYMLLVQLVF